MPPVSSQLRLFDVFNRILQQPTLEKTHPEVHQLIKYITRCFFKRLKEYPALPLEVRPIPSMLLC